MSKKSADASRAARAQAALEARRRGDRNRQMAVAGAIVAVLVLVVGVVFFLSSRQDTTGDVPQATPDGATDDYGLVVGDASAPTEIVIYEDPQCPVCAQLEDAVGEPLADAVEAGEVRVEYRVVSFLDNASTNDYSSRAANVLAATYDVAGAEAFAELHETLFAEQTPEGGPGHEDDQLVEYAVAAGADEAEIRPLVEGGAYDQWVENATDAMSRNGVNGTPTVFVDGERAEDPLQGILDALS